MENGIKVFAIFFVRNNDYHILVSSISCNLWTHFKFISLPCVHIVGSKPSAKVLRVVPEEGAH